MFARAINLSLRSFSIFSKFILIFLVSNYGSLEDLGRFAILQTSILLSTFLIGLDYYNYSHRLYSHNKDRLVFLQQFLAYFAIYILICLLFPFYPEKYFKVSFTLFLIILIGEHFSQEIFRVLILLNKQFFAYTFYFFRTAFWVYLYALFIYFKLIIFDLDGLVKFWSIFSFLNFAISLLILFHIVPIKGNLNISFNNFVLGFIRGAKVSFTFLCTTILFKLLEYQYRYILDINWNYKLVGIYSFLQNIASLFVTIVDVFFFSFTYSYILDNENRDVLMWVKMAKKNIIFAAVFYLVLLCFMKDIILKIISKPEISNYKYEFLILFFGNFFYNLSLIYHYLLYVESRDREILYSTLLSFFFSTLVSLSLIPSFGILGACSAYSVGFVVLYLYKRKYYLKYCSLF
jgi:O-antigen/teichoic acid export membrane protein